jgi:hypothetical protein
LKIGPWGRGWLGAGVGHTRSAPGPGARPGPLAGREGAGWGGVGRGRARPGRAGRGGAGRGGAGRAEPGTRPVGPGRAGRGGAGWGWTGRPACKAGRGTAGDAKL